MKTTAKPTVRTVRTPKAWYDESGIRPPQNLDVYTDETRPVLYDSEGQPLRRAIGFTPQHLVLETKAHLE